MPTEPASAAAAGIVLPAFEDGLGRRYRPITRFGDTPPEILCFRHELTDVPSFEFSLRERVARLAELRHPHYVRIRKVDRLSDERGTVALMSDCAPGSRLVEILAATERGGPVLTLEAALCLIRQLVPAMALLHKQAGVAHGAIAPERLIVTPQARLMIVEHVTGAALEQLRYSRERYWKELRVALPASEGVPRLDESADLTQLGVVALSLILGRPLKDDEYPALAGDLVRSADARTADGGRESLPSDLRDWLLRALQLDGRHSFTSLAEAENALDRLPSVEGKSITDISGLETFLESHYNPTTPAPPPPKPNLVADIPIRRSDVSIDTLTRVPPLNFESPSNDPPDAAEEWQSTFQSETGSTGFGRRKWIAAGLVAAIAAAVGGGFLVARQSFSSAPPPVTTGTMKVDTKPSGGTVAVDGVERGVAPLILTLPAGRHTLEVRGSGEPRTIPITITAGAEVSQYLELPGGIATAGQLQVQTEPTGARISVDDVPRGIAPLVLQDLSPGEHTVTAESDLGSLSQTVKIEAGVTKSLVVPLNTAQALPASGWVSVSAPVEMELYEQGRSLGTSGPDRIKLPAGRHDVEIVNEPLGYRETRTVEVSAGRVANISISLPTGTVSLNAIPWASVSIDGESIGDTPIGNLSITIGSHEVVFRNPQFAEQRRVIAVTERSPVRLSIDLTKP